MANENLADFKEDFALLIESGFVAVKQLDEAGARQLFKAAEALKPESTAPKIGLGYIALNKLEIKEAKEIFSEVTHKEPDNHLAWTFLGICYLLSKTDREKGVEIIKKAMEETSDPTVKNLGEVSLEWADKDLKNLKTPLIK